MSATLTTRYYTLKAALPCKINLSGHHPLYYLERAHDYNSPFSFPLITDGGGGVSLSFVFTAEYQRMQQILQQYVVSIDSEQVGHASRITPSPYDIYNPFSNTPKATKPLANHLQPSAPSLVHPSPPPPADLPTPPPLRTHNDRAARSLRRQHPDRSINTFHVCLLLVLPDSARREPHR